MQKQIQVSISREEFLAFLAEKGVETRDGIEIFTEQYDRESSVEFPIIVRWNEAITPPRPEFSLNFVFNEKLMQEFRDMRGDNNLGKIAVIREVRRIANWTLKDAKEWVEHHFGA